MTAKKGGAAKDSSDQSEAVDVATSRGLRADGIVPNDGSVLANTPDFLRDSKYQVHRAFAVQERKDTGKPDYFTVANQNEVEVGVPKALIDHYVAAGYLSETNPGA